MLSLVISVTYLNLTFFSLDVCILLWNMDLFSTITDGAVWLMTESIFALALSMNRRISLFALSEPWYTLVNDGLVLGPSAVDNGPSAVDNGPSAVDNGPSEF